MRQDQPVKTLRKIPPGHRSITGVMPSRFPSGHLPFESKLEMDFLTLLQLDNRIFDVVTQPTTLELTVDGQARTYTPDVLVSWHGAMPHPFAHRQVMFEVKPLNVLREKQTLWPKYRAARRNLARQGIGFRVVTERSIRTPRLANAQLIAPVLVQPQDIEMITRIALLVRDQGPRRLGDIRLHLEAEGAIRGSIMDAAYDMIGSRELRCNLDSPITDETAVTWWGDVILEEIFART
ncbi:hypothetical protein D3C85_850210 [compost metagenome]